jgi:hypothetical protein
MTTPEATERPWRADLSDTNGHCGWAIVDVAGDCIATVYANLVRAPRPSCGLAAMPENAESIANAQLICDAVNNYERLLEVEKAAKMLADWVDDNVKDPACTVPLGYARTALAGKETEEN